MARVVISFVGRRGHSVGYTFPGGMPDGMLRRQRDFFLTVLLAWLAWQGKPADRVIVIGTMTSHWRLLRDDLDRLDHDLPSGTTRPGICYAEMAEARDDAIYVETLETIRGAIGATDQVVLDLSQGMRHQPLIALLAALYLDRLPANRDVTIEHVFSASVERDADDNIIQRVQVRDLRPILDLAAWVFALGAFEASGDTGVFTDVLMADGNARQAVEQLCKGAALERATRTEAAAVTIRDAIERLDATADRTFALRGAGRAFAPDFENSLAWVHPIHPFDQQRALAKRHLKHEDWLRDATVMYETCCIRLLDTMDKTKPKPEFAKLPAYKQRHAAAHNYVQSNPTWFATIRVGNEAAFDQRVADFKRLTAIRNALAHAGEPDDAVEAIVAVPDDLHAELCRLYDTLLADKRPFP